MSQTEGTSKDEIKIVRGKVDSLSVYEITDNELETLERGSPNSILLNFAIFLFTIGVSFLVNLLAVDIESIKLYVTFLVLTVIGILGGLILLIIWFRARRSISGVIKKIKGRIPSVEYTEANTESSS